MSQPTKVITIAGLDASGRAGIQADGKGFSKYHLYGLNVITSIVTQTPLEWAHEVHPIDSQIISKELDTACDDYKLIDDELINTKYAHGTGCTFSSCCTAEVAKNPQRSIEDVVTNAKKYVTEQLRTTAFKLNDHVGTITHQ